MAGNRTKRKPRTRKGNWGVFGIRREKVPDIRRKRTLETLKARKEEREAEKRVAELKRKTTETQAEAGYYEAKKRKKKAKQSSSPWPMVTVKTPKLKKKRQGKRLSSRSRIKLV